MTGRVAGCYSGCRGTMQRQYDLEKHCQNCGPPVRAAYRQEICHDCISEGNAAYMPTPAIIKAECAEIRKEWTDVRYNRSGEELLPYEIPEVKVGMFR